MEKSRILIVEDDLDNLELIRILMLRAGHAVLEAHNGTHAIDVARKEKPDLIILDVNLPELDGFSTAQILKSGSDTQHIPIVALTVRTELEDRERAFKVGCDGYITKPMNVSTLADEIGMYLKKSR